MRKASTNTASELKEQFVDFVDIFRQAHSAARKATLEQEALFNLKGQQDCCGFAWVDILEYQGKKIRKNSKLGKLLVELDMLSYRGFQMWNPSNVRTQRLTSLERGAHAASEVLKQHGFTAYSGSRMD